MNITYHFVTEEKLSDFVWNNVNRKLGTMLKTIEFVCDMYSDLHDLYKTFTECVEEIAEVNFAQEEADGAMLIENFSTDEFADLVEKTHNIASRFKWLFVNYHASSSPNAPSDGAMCMQLINFLTNYDWFGACDAGITDGMGRIDFYDMVTNCAIFNQQEMIDQLRELLNNCDDKYTDVAVDLYVYICWLKSMKKEEK